MRRYTLFGLALALVAVVVLAGALVVSAQEGPGPIPAPQPIRPAPYVPGICSNPRFDMDGNGRLDKRDILSWEEQARERMCIDEHGRQLPPAGCEIGKLDVNGDGQVSMADFWLLYNYLYTCMFPPTDRNRP